MSWDEVRDEGGRGEVEIGRKDFFIVRLPSSCGHYTSKARKALEQLEFVADIENDTLYALYASPG
jgi:hypothetical protein